MPRNLIPEGFRDDVSEQVLTEHKFTNEFIASSRTGEFQRFRNPHARNF